MFHNVMAAKMAAGGSLVRRFAQPVPVATTCLVLALLIIYFPGLGNGLVFDDSYLTEGLFNEYASPFSLQARLLSYGSFVWLHSLAGDGWWKQRLLNLTLHAATVAALWAFYREILRCIELPARATPLGGPANSPALAFAIGAFALNPVATYAVAYLIQRSILLATLFVALGLAFFARALRTKDSPFHVLALACYALAVISKEYAILAPLAALPVYVVVARPSRRRLTTVSLAAAALVAIATLALWKRYSFILGHAFDEYSHIYLEQLGQLNPDAQRHAYALSVMNQAWLFFRYGFDWLLPWAGQLSIDLRPPFPVSWLSFPQTLGLVGYPLVVGGSAVLVVRYRDWRALLGLSLLIPALLFVTEFATVWVQDPFVLYRSYLWAMGVPGLVFLLVCDVPARGLLVAGLLVGALLVWQSADRVASLRDSETAWTDAIAKLPDDPRAVGRWFPYLNRGSTRVDNNEFALAMLDFEASSRLGDLGMGAFNMGALLSAQGRQKEALEAFDRAEREGYSLYNLPFQRALALLALGRREEALAQLELTARQNPPSPTRELMLLHIGRLGMQLGKAKEALGALEELARLQPANREGRQLLAMACLMNGKPERARELLDRLLMEQASAPAFYGRALANYRLGRKAEALADIENAIRLGGENANLREWRSKILAMP
jgi:tetratricopeptide (TPR) repeat protein